jgi:hypothetical protein
MACFSSSVYQTLAADWRVVIGRKGPTIQAETGFPPTETIRGLTLDLLKGERSANVRSPGAATGWAENDLS